MANIEDTLIREQDRIGPKIYRRSFNTSVWNKLIPKEVWPDSLSDSIQVLTIDRNLPDDTDTWTDVVVDGTCIQVADQVPTGQTLRSYHMTEKALESVDICVDATRNAFQVQQQIAAMYENLVAANRYVWKRRAMIDYSDMCEHKLIAAPGLPEASSHFPHVAASFLLNQKILNKIYLALIEDSAEFDGGSLGMQDGKPQFILVTDAETSDNLMREDATNTAFLWNRNRVPELLAPLGVERGFRGFYHTIEKLPQRYEFVGGQYVEVEPYETASATKGTKKVIRDAYRRATYTKSVIFLPTVMSFMVPGPITTKGSGTSWNAQTYVGDFKWRNIIDRETNPDGTIGYYRALLKAGTKPVHPEFGFAIIHLRCPGDIDGQGCPSDVDGSATLDSSESFFV